MQEVLRSPGETLDSATSAFFETRFGHDFDHVRVHTDEPAAVSARALNARAFTWGQDIVFAEGEFSPDTLNGRRLLAHELAHTIQQGFGRHGRGAPSSAPPMVQLKPDDEPDINTIDWKEGVTLAEKLAKKKASKERAKRYYRSLVVRAAAHVTAPKPLSDTKPTIDDIRWSWKKGSKYAATVDPKRVDNFPGDYWKWVLFNPSAVTSDEVFTVSAIVHELDHAAHAKALYDAWKSSGKKGKWDEFYVSHFEKWTEKPIRVGESAGLVGAIAGLPSKIRPSVLEFRAYTNQLVEFFHKLPLGSQDIVVKGAVLHYPLKKRTVKAAIGDPAMNLAAARKKLLDYFKAPPIADLAKRRRIKVLLSHQFRSSLFLFRPRSDIDQIRKDFSDIVDFKSTTEEKREARKKYVPEK